MWSCPQYKLQYGERTRSPSGLSLRFPFRPTYLPRAAQAAKGLRPALEKVLPP